MNKATTTNSGKTNLPKGAKQKQDDGPVEMELMQHLKELRKRLIYVIIAVTIAAVICFNFTAEIFYFLNIPFGKYFDLGTLIGTGPAEPFILRLKLAVFAGIVLGAPVIFFQIWQFVSPGLYAEERKLVIPFIAATTFLLFLGLAFAYCLVLPLAYEFFASQYQLAGLVPTIRITEHLNLMLKLLLAFAVVFQLPVVSLLLARAGLISSAIMLASWRYVLVAVFVISAVFTPPDIFSQFLMALPVMFLYFTSIVLVKMTERKAQKAAAADSDAKPDKD